MKRPSQREMNKRALHEAAAIIESEDFTSLFGEEDSLEWADDEIMNERMDKAQRYAVEKIRKMAGVFAHTHQE